MVACIAKEQGHGWRKAARLHATKAAARHKSSKGSEHAATMALEGRFFVAENGATCCAAAITPLKDFPAESSRSWHGFIVWRLQGSRALACIWVRQA